MTSVVPSGEVSGAAAVRPLRSAGLTYWFNGRIRTMNAACPVATHMLTCGDRILFCGEGPGPLGFDWRESGFRSVRERWAGDVSFRDLGGAVVVPGLIDAHVHFVWWSHNLALADLGSAEGENEAVGLLEAHLAEHGRPPAGAWIRGFGWSHNVWQGGRLPARESLDRAFPSNPAFLSSKCGHLAWVNSAALVAAGVTGTTAQPAGGEIEMRSAGGGLEPTGILKETAISLVHDRIPVPDAAEWRRAFDRGQRIAHQCGLTGMHTPEDLETFEFLQVMHREERLTMRVGFMIPCAAIGALEELRIAAGAGDDHLRISAVKLFSDGSLGGRTALMYEPYEGEPDNRGIRVAEYEEIADITLRANRLGLPMAIHAIGDRAVGDVVRAYEAAGRATGIMGVLGPRGVIPNRVEHLQSFHEQDRDLLRRVRPTASMQPVHLCADMGPADRYWGERSRRAYAMATLTELGCPFALGSDAPVEPIEPFYGMYAAATRRNLDGEPHEGWHPAERVSRETALEGYTTGAARAEGRNDRQGVLAQGFLADFVVLPADPLTCGDEELRDMKPLATVSGGEFVYRSESWTY